MRVWYGVRGPAGEAHVYNKDGSVFPSERSLKVRCYSTEGFDWATCTGPARQLALALLLEMFEPLVSLGMAADFTKLWVAKFPWQAWILREADLWEFKSGASLMGLANRAKERLESSSNGKALD